MSPITRRDFLASAGAAGFAAAPIAKLFAEPIPEGPEKPRRRPD